MLAWLYADGEDYKNLGVNESGYQFLVAGDDFDSIPDDQVEFAPGKTISLRRYAVLMGSHGYKNGF